jgi:hypothetical protein
MGTAEASIGNHLGFQNTRGRARKIDGNPANGQFHQGK